MKPTTTSAVLVASFCVWANAQAQTEIGKVFQSHNPDGQAYLVVYCHQLDECFEAADQYCKGPYQALDEYPSPVAFRFECKNKPTSDPISPSLNQTASHPASPSKGFPNTEDYYPIASRRQGEEGTPVVKVCLGADGKLTEPPSIDKTSGFPLIDAAAIQLATDADGHYKPATRDGKPISACSRLGIRFSLHP